MKTGVVVVKSIYSYLKKENMEWRENSALKNM